MPGIGLSCQPAGCRRPLSQQPPPVKTDHTPAFPPSLQRREWRRSTVTGDGRVSLSCCHFATLATSTAAEKLWRRSEAQIITATASLNNSEVLEIRKTRRALIDKTEPSFTFQFNGAITQVGWILSQHQTAICLKHCCAKTTMDIPPAPTSKTLTYPFQLASPPSLASTPLTSPSHPLHRQQRRHKHHCTQQN
jgi:hypothetical protein